MYDLANYYEALAQDEWVTQWDSEEHYHDNGFDHNLSPILTSHGLGLFRWGLVPASTKSLEDANLMKVKNLNCRSEEMFDKKTWLPSLLEAKRCLVPLTGFFDHHWVDAKGKDKIPYYIRMKNQPIFSAAGLYASWQLPGTNEELHSYTILTTDANPLMAHIHNSKKRMPLIVAREMEKEWLDPALSQEEVMMFCEPFNETKMEAYTISKRISSKDSNVADVLKQQEYFSTGSLF